MSSGKYLVSKSITLNTISAQVKNIAKKCDMFFIIGSSNSSNSARLVEVAKKSGCRESELIFSGKPIPIEKIKGCKKIEIISIAPMISEAMKRIANSTSVSSLFK